MNKVSKDQFVAVLNEAGMTDEQKRKLHAAFEKKFPEGHQSFLEFLGISAGEIKEIRERSKKG